MKFQILQTVLLFSSTLLQGCGSTDSSPPASTPGFAEVNGTTLYYEVQGSGHPLVLLHGGNLDLRMWDQQFAQFAQEYRVIRYDARGFGRSGAWSAPYQAHEDLRALLDDLAIERAHLVGLSMGGRIALDFALENPERVGALVLAGPGLSGFENPIPITERDWLLSIWETAQLGDAVGAAELWLESPYMAPAMSDPELAPLLRTLATENSRVWVDEDTRVPLSPPAIGRLEDVLAPTLLIVGSRDAPEIHRVAELLTAGIPGLRREVFEGSGHMINMERPDQFNRVVLDFLNGYVPSAEPAHRRPGPTEKLPFETDSIERDDDGPPAAAKPASVADFKDRGAYGTVIRVEPPFGNVQTSFVESDLRSLGIAPGTPFQLRCRQNTFDVLLGQNFGDVPRGEWVAFLSPEGTLTLARNLASAAESLKCEPGDTVFIGPSNRQE